MKNRLFFFIAAVLLCVPMVLGGCRGSGGVDLPSSETAGVTTKLTVTAGEYKEENIHIRYPQLQGLADASKQAELNKQIKTDVWEHTVQVSLRSYPKEEIHYDMDYQVTWQTDTMLSVVYTGSAQVKGGAFPTNEIYGATFDLKSGKKLALSDFRPVNADLVQEIKQSADITTYEGKAQEGLAALVEGISSEDMICGLNEGEPGYTFHVTAEMLVISVPVAHAAGDYARITLTNS